MVYFVCCNVWMPFLSKHASNEEKENSTLTYTDIYLYVSNAQASFLLPELIMVGVCSGMHTRCQVDKRLH